MAAATKHKSVENSTKNPKPRALVDAGQGELSFRAQVLAQVAAIPRGKVATYGLIALLAGNPKAARAVGTVLHGLRYCPAEGLDIPWHRVINSQGKISAPNDGHRMQIQRQLLIDEGIVFDAHGKCRLLDYLWQGGALPED